MFLKDNFTATSFIQNFITQTGHHNKQICKPKRESRTGQQARYLSFTIFLNRINHCTDMPKSSLRYPFLNCTSQMHIPKHHLGSPGTPRSGWDKQVMAGDMRWKLWCLCPGWHVGSHTVWQLCDTFAMLRATVCGAAHSITEEMMTVLHRIIHFPKPDKMEEVREGFADTDGHEAFKFTAGAIHGCHIQTRPSAEPQKKCFINWKLFQSVILQGICDSQGKFLDIYVGNTGSVDDALVLHQGSQTLVLQGRSPV